jgi:hypothetical protein
MKSYKLNTVCNTTDVPIENLLILLQRITFPLLYVRFRIILFKYGRVDLQEIIQGNYADCLRI